MKKLILIAGLIGMMGCSPWEKQSNGKYQVFLDNNFSEHQQGLVQEAFNSWEDQTNHLVNFKFTKDWRQENGLITISPTTMVELTTLNDQSDLSDGDLELLGRTNYEGTSSLIQVSIDLDDVIFKQVSEHEIGHALGLQHTGEGTLMNPNVVGGATSITCWDIDQFCDIWDCNPQTLKGCN